MSKHTPGPWEIVQQDAGIVIRTESPKKTKYGASRYAAIGGFERSDSEQIAEAMANAHLMASAPELLAALILAKDMMIANDLSLPRTFEVIDEAIAKAKGEL